MGPTAFAPLFESEEGPAAIERAEDPLRTSPTLRTPLAWGISWIAGFAGLTGAVARQRPHSYVDKRLQTGEGGIAIAAMYALT